MRLPAYQGFQGRDRCGEVAAEKLTAPVPNEIAAQSSNGSIKLKSHPRSGDRSQLEIETKSETDLISDLNESLFTYMMFLTRECLVIRLTLSLSNRSFQLEICFFSSISCSC